jgi:hypothetical protein
MDNIRTYYDNIGIYCICDKHQDHTVLDMQANEVKLLNIGIPIGTESILRD